MPARRRRSVVPRAQAAGDRAASRRPASTPCCRAAASSPARPPSEAAVRELAEECSLTGTVVRHLFDGDHGGRAASYFLVDVPEGEPVLGGAGGRGAVARGTTTSRSGPPPRSCRCSGCSPRASATSSSTRSGRCGSTWPAPTTGRSSSGCGSSTSTTSRSSGTAPPDADGLFRAGRLASYADGRGDRVAYLARLGDVPCGFALVRGRRRGGPRLMGEFFVTRSARGRGMAAAFARQVVPRVTRAGGRSRSRTRTRGPRRSGAGSPPTFSTTSPSRRRGARQASTCPTTSGSGVSTVGG